MYRLAEVWRKAGVDVIFLFGVDRFVPADLAILHVDRSLVPEEYVEFARRYPVSLNDRVADIRKQTISTLRITADASYSGPVIVKTDLNAAGRPEKRLGRSFRRRLLARAIPMLRGIEKEKEELYNVFSSIDQVPMEIWEDSGQIVERFFPERKGGGFYVRTMECLGDFCKTIHLCSPDPIVGWNNSVAYELIENDPKIVRYRQKIGLDFGKIDYVVHEGRPIILDLNKTTGSGSAHEGFELGTWYREQAAGLGFYLESIEQTLKLERP